MSDHRSFISVMSAIGSSVTTGTITFQLDTYDAESNISVFMIPVTGLTSSMDESEVGREICDQLNATFVAQGYDYRGIPSFSATAYQATFRATRSEHVVCMWSQCQFVIQEHSNDTASTLKISQTPIWLTLSRAKALANAFTGGFTNPTGTLLDDSQIISLLELSCANIVSYLNNNIVVCTYFGEWRTNDVKSLFTSPGPGLSLDTIKIRSKWAFDLFWSMYYTPQYYNWVRHTGELNFQLSNINVKVFEAFDLDNEVRFTFVAGNYLIPTDIQYAAVQFSASILLAGLGFDSISELGGGSFSVKFGDAQNAVAGILRPISAYAQKKMK